jgi:hypothetical protein
MQAFAGVVVKGAMAGVGVEDGDVLLGRVDNAPEIALGGNGSE